MFHLNAVTIARVSLNVSKHFQTFLPTEPSGLTQMTRFETFRLFTVSPVPFSYLALYAPLEASEFSSTACVGLGLYMLLAALFR